MKRVCFGARKNRRYTRSALRIFPSENIRLAIFSVLWSAVSKCDVHKAVYPRDVNLRSVRKYSFKLWKKKFGYHIRSLVETVMFRFKAIFSDKINARKFTNQITEFNIKARMLNIFHQMGMPEYITEYFFKF